jgi:cystathionine beta-lyase
VIRALLERVEHGVFGYAKELPELYKTICRRMEERYNWKIGPKDIILLPGVMTGVMMACQSTALDYPGAGILVQTPMYPPILTAYEKIGLNREENGLVRNPDGTYEIDLKSFEAAVTPQTRIFTLCNPHNPVGRAFKREELEGLAEICLKHDITICSDEIHCDLIYPGAQHIPIASIDPEISKKTITLIAATKTFNIAGLKCSAAIVQDPDLREKFKNGGMGFFHGVNLMGMIATQAAYREGQEWLDQLLVYLEGNRDYVYETIKKDFPSVTMAKPEATYLAWLDFRNSGIEGNPLDFFLKNARVALNDGAAFGENGKGFLRLNFGCPRATLEDALGRMKRAMDGV